MITGDFVEAYVRKNACKEEIRRAEASTAGGVAAAGTDAPVRHLRGCSLQACMEFQNLTPVHLEVKWFQFRLSAKIGLFVTLISLSSTLNKKLAGQTMHMYLFV